MTEKIEIDDIKRLQVKPGDVLLVTVPEHTTRQIAEIIKERFADHLPDVKVIVMTAGIEVGVVSRLPDPTPPTVPDPGISERAERKHEAAR